MSLILRVPDLVSSVEMVNDEPGVNLPLEIESLVTEQTSHTTFPRERIQSLGDMPPGEFILVSARPLPLRFQFFLEGILDHLLLLSLSMSSGLFEVIKYRLNNRKLF